MISTFTDEALQQLTSEVAGLETQVKRSRDAARERAADADRDLFTHGKSLAYLAMLRQELDDEIAKREAKQ